METEVATVSHLQKSFNGKVVLKDMNLSLHQAENLVVLGQSGSGKSVLIKCLIGLLETDGGNATLFGKDLATMTKDELNAARRRVGFLFQSAALYDSMTVRENLEFPLRNSKSISKEEMDAMVLEALRNVGLEDAIDKMPSELSGGMRKRIGLARTLILNPEIILYDEPTTGLDPITSGEISKLILEVQKKYGAPHGRQPHDHFAGRGRLC
jgi:phospholipid/cholesterol/gamma-HCH transport system ATP-binding protein